MQISVIIPTFNADATIDEVLVSILEQSFKPFEVIVVDDCSLDNTVQRAMKHKGVRVVVLDNNFGGPARPRNVGIKEAQGTHIAFCDADDVWHKDKLKIQSDLMVSENVNFVSSSREIVSELKKFNKTNDLEFPNFSRVTYRDFLYRNPIVTSSVLINKSLLENNRFSEKKELVAVEDYELFSLLHKNYYSVKASDALVGYLENGMGISSSKLLMAIKFYRIKRIYHSPLNASFILLVSIILRLIGIRA